MNASDIFAAASVVIAGFSCWQSWKASKGADRARSDGMRLLEKQVEFQSRLVAIEQGREQSELLQSRQAVIRAELRRTTRGNYRLVLINTGSAAATDVQVQLDGVPLTEHPAACGEEVAKLIGPGSEASCLMAIHNDCHPPFDLAVTWKDGSGINGEYQTTITWQ